MKSNMKYLFGVVFSGIVVLVFFFQNCAKIAYRDVQDDGQPGNVIDNVPGGNDALTGPAVPGMVRSISISPELSLDKATPFKLLFVIDNSSSMQNVSSKLSRAAKAVLEVVKGRPLEIKVINTSHPRDRSVGAKNSFDLSYQYWISAGDKRQYVGSYDEYFASNQFRGINSIFNLSANNRFVLPASQQSDLQIETFLNKVNSSIESMGISGSTRENGLCNFLLTLYEEGGNQFFKKGDYGASVILSDENDESVFGKSINYYNSGCFNEVSAESNFQKVDLVYFSFMYYIISGSFNYDGIDGDSQPGRYKENFYLALPRSYSNRQLEKTCDAELENIVRNKYATGRKTYKNIVFESCKLGGGYGDYWHTSTEAGGRDIDFCRSPISINGESFSNLYKAAESINSQAVSIYGPIVPGSCSRRYRENGGDREFYRIRNAIDPEITEFRDVNKAIKNRIDELFGNSGFYLSNIIHDESCPSIGGSSVGVQFKNLAALLPGRASISPICSFESDSGLLSMSKAFKHIVNKSYSVEKRPSEKIKSVEVKRGSEIIKLSESQYRVFENRIEFDFDLRIDDVINVKLEIE